MWLINTETYLLEDITNPQKGSYAILSHTWEDEEVSFQQYQKTGARNLKGFKKIDMTIELARKRGLKYAWIDTCCIDKSSSAELSEAINSMFKWYSEAAVCLAFLSDLSNAEIADLLSTPYMTPRTAQLAKFKQRDDHQKSYNELISRCRWFSRGWTLQELIAPQIVEFYDDEWTLVGTKETLLWTIHSITRIPLNVLSNNVSFRKVPVAQRMSWAADRSTTRVEDIAYCLFGLLGVNLAPLYGEGENSFIRLQEELLRQSDDITLFAWTAVPKDDQPYRGILARSPREFRNSHHIRRLEVPTYVGEFRMTNKGLRVNQSDLFRGMGKEWWVKRFGFRPIIE
ncbi:HET-domain-containing protein [Xylaria bambusicola]|uniref:HET-domain-containing protein n=1 Tax=Xylaria bambusicola TaxID=326684 RepID=UPI002007F910|nr:HET-domain-containing protein [Xylaria bambusicola]KAI0521287.1 HET-domain-containing protein [Xylaria bambusicola]